MLIHLKQSPNARQTLYCILVYRLYGHCIVYLYKGCMGTLFYTCIKVVWTLYCILV